MIIVASSLSLLAIVAGMFLYAQTIKDNLNQFFKVVAYFIVIVGFINLFIGSAFIMMEKIYKHHQKMEMKSHGHCSEKMKKHNCKHTSCKGMNNKYKSCEDMDNRGSCHNKTESEHCGEMRMMHSKNCCKSMMEKEQSCMNPHMMMKKDSIIIKQYHQK